MSKQKTPATITNVSQHARPLDAGPVLGPGETARVDDTGKGDAHYEALGDLVIRDADFVFPVDPDGEPEPDVNSDDHGDVANKTPTSGRARGGKDGAQ